IARTNLEKTQEQQPTGKSGLGALGQRIASFLHSIRTALGLVKSETGVTRQEQALTGFKSSLKSEYGRDIANKSLEDGGIRSRSIKLRDTDVTRSLASAHERREARIGDNESLRQKALGGGVFARTEDQKNFNDLMGGKNGDTLRSEYDS